MSESERQVVGREDSAGMAGKEAHGSFTRCFGDDLGARSVTEVEPIPRPGSAILLLRCDQTNEALSTRHPSELPAGFHRLFFQHNGVVAGGCGKQLDVGLGACGVEGDLPPLNRGESVAGWTEGQLLCELEGKEGRHLLNGADCILHPFNRGLPHHSRPQRWRRIDR